ncbi:RagB/SusD family nutrient uptake outer membrane protein [Muricauda sp. TY007]|uniref:RagB/SusD family nutrient uptake outer membrane protein n=1 Tax=Allomuricauda sp. TY007 TaxID=2683200 RepID=UPI0013C267B8|nr:RagB/SusD family nutrient uptake outer membrane protein [Muricauda sp. TY007]NDV15767.1 RagB/SusD family nutrient uptake outer membrane protein [Muricauda sp. TY007]
MKSKFKYLKKIKILFFRFSWISSFVAIILYAFPSCEGFVKIEPPIDELVTETVFTNDENATATARGIYLKLIESSVFTTGASSITFLGGMSADELIDFEGINNLGFYHNELNAENDKVNSNWQLLYETIYRVNAMLEGLSNSTGITPEVKDLLEGESKCIRAFCYFYLVNLWGDVPLITKTDYEMNRLASRKPVSEIYELILSDLKQAQELLPEDYAHADGERIRVNEGTATALLARVYLYLKDWINAEEQASRVIENPKYALTEDLNNVFLKNSVETIWQLKQTVGHTQDGNIFILIDSPKFTALSESLMTTFELGDKRKTNWIGNFSNDIGTWNYPFKYKVKTEPDPEKATEYFMVMRLAEQYLIRAEARVQQGNISGAQEDLNIIRYRAGLSNTLALTPEELLTVIYHERQVELFAEWGHRWLDLKRINLSNEVLGPLKSSWGPTDVLWPIPQSELDNNPNLFQNSGY